ncbi:cation:proton antiporter [bacterium]|jgi:Kef-type K+ transport system membrane component KefB|nr:cation:proton antiporter [bacterium]MBT3850318.1 cation:proton antiporter [bacterium]MDG2445961.1 cation:proton antiporter [Thermodesulfobacteriota bacterium]NSW99736.1 cation:proton antiporter [bacterium]|tara:strand:- start:11894 stop:13126 length:1233 start_codon:yes stop_codon:yes gene_type:complete
MSLDDPNHYSIGSFFIALASIFIVGKVLSSIFVRFKQPEVLGELTAGVILGTLGLIPLLGQPGHEVLFLLSEVGVAILLFEIGLETDLNELLSVGLPSLTVAILGVVVPFFLGFYSVYLLGDLGFISSESSLFLTALTIGATLTATSVGITARVLSELNKLKAIESKVILGAAVIDDVIGLIILAIVGGLISSSNLGQDVSIEFSSVAIITGKAFGFLFLAIVIGRLFTTKLFIFIHSLKARGSLLLGALSYTFIFAFLAQFAGLAPIIGAFAAGLLLAKTNQKTLIEDRLKPVADVFIPIFFIMVGAAVDISVFNPFIKENIAVIILALVLFVIAIIGKLVSGLGAFSLKANKLVIGIGMIPRGEVGLIFASMGLATGVLNSSDYSALTVMVMLTTFIAPPLLYHFFKD